MRDAVADAEPHRVGVVRVGLGQPELALEQAGAPAGVDQPARVGRACVVAVLRPGDAVRLAAVLGQVDAAHQCAVDEAHAAARRLLGRGSSRRCRGRSGSSAPRGSGWRRSRSPGRCRAGLRRRRSGSRTSSAARRAGAASGRAPCRSSGRRSRPTIRRPCAPHAAPDARGARAPAMSRSAKRLLELQRQRQAGQAAAHDDDVVLARCGSVMAASALRVRARSCSDSVRRQRQARARSALAAAPALSKSGSASAIALPASARAARRARRGAAACAPLASDQSKAATVRSVRARREHQRARPAGRGWSSPTRARRRRRTSKPTSSTASLRRPRTAPRPRAGRRRSCCRRPSDASCSPPCSRCRWSSSRPPRCAPSCGTWSARAASGSLASVAAHVVVDRRGRRAPRRRRRAASPASRPEAAHRARRRPRARAPPCRARAAARPAPGAAAPAAWPADRPAAPRRGRRRARRPSRAASAPRRRGLRCRGVPAVGDRRSCRALPCRTPATQLLPPKPKELLSAMRTSPCAGCEPDLRAAAGVEHARC